VDFRERISGNGRLVAAAAAPAAWIGLSALFGGVQVMDWVVAAVLLVVFAVGSRRKKPAEDSPQQGIYGPPE
jgi:hypothetical protein